MRHLSPLHATGIGKALISELPTDEISELIGRTYDSYTPHTLTSLDDLTAALKAVRRRGYATEVEELAFGRACVPAPIRGRGGEIVAALSLSGPLSVMNLTARQDELAMTVIEYADQISSSLGYHASVPPPAPH